MWGLYTEDVGCRRRQVELEEFINWVKEKGGLNEIFKRLSNVNY